MAPSAHRRSPPVWPFVVGGMLAAAAGLLLRPAGGAARLGQLSAGVVLGVLVWSVVARRWVLSTVLVLGWIAFAALWQASRGGASGRVQGCLEACASQESIALSGDGMTGQPVDEGCRCICEQVKRRLPPEVARGLDRDPGAPEAARQIDGVAEAAEQACAAGGRPGR